MHYRTLLTPLLFLALYSTAQSPISVSALNAVSVRIRQPHHPFSDARSSAGTDTPSSPGFSHFEVLDERADTGRIGIHTCIPDFGHNYDRQLIFDRSAAKETAEYLNHYFTRPESPYTALVILRTLWLS